MSNDIVRKIPEIIESYLATHPKLKVGKINSINGNYADIEFFEQITVNGQIKPLPILQDVPLLQQNFSFNNNCGVIVPYAVGDNVIVGILDNIKVATFFENNNVFQGLFPHNLSNAIVLGKVNTAQQEARTTNGVLIYKGDTQIELTEAGVNIAKDGESLRAILSDLTTAISSATVTVASFGTPTPLDNASTISNIISRIEDLLT